MTKKEQKKELSKIIKQLRDTVNHVDLVEYKNKNLYTERLISNALPFQVINTGALFTIQFGYGE